MMIDETTYREIYGQLNRYEDIDRLNRKYRSKPWDFFLVVYTQRTIRQVTSKYQKVRSKLPHLKDRWHRGETFLEIANDLNFSPVMTAFLILTSEEIGRKTFNKMINYPRSVKEERLKKELMEVRDHDKVYSPEGNRVQRKRGIKGEERMRRWLDERGVEYKREEELRAQGGKTPDFLLEKPIHFRGEEINWIESKGSFGDLREVKKNLKKQLFAYYDLFGTGMVIYWYGILDNLPVVEGVVIETEEVLKDHWDI